MNDSNLKENTESNLLKMGKGYLIFLFIYMILYEFMDSYTTSYYTSVVSYIEADFGIDDSTFYLIQAVASLGLLLVLVIQNLADVWGRKPIMIVVFFGMGFASFILLIAHNVLVFTIGFLLSWVFFSSDIWVIIISEEAPAEKRATYSYIIALFGALGAIAIPVCRGIFVKVAPSVDPSVWRGMNYLALLAMPLALLGFGMKETVAFKNKKSFRNLPENGERKALIKGEQKLMKQQKEQKLFLPFKTEHKLKLIIFMIFGLMMGMSAAVNSTIEKFFTSNIVEKYGASPDVVTNISYVAVLGTFIFFGFTGILADKLGRKRLFYIYFSLNVMFYVLLVFFVDSICKSESYWVFALAAFFANGSFWGIFMLSKTNCVENFPTSIRGTSSGWRSFMYAVGLIVGSLVSSGLATFMSLGHMFVLFAVLNALIMVPLIAKFLPEMKGVKIIDS
ncbi:MAG: MFS transporter [Promethearchaeota archaeon]